MWNDFGDSFGLQYTAVIFLPTFMVLIVVATWAATNGLWKAGVLEANKPGSIVMKKNHTINMVGIIVNALYVTLVKIVVAYFECKSNPSAPPTLTRYRYLECDVGMPTDSSGLPAMIYGMLFYVIGVYALFIHGARNFPTKKDDRDYRECWTFMLYRWRTDCYYWGCVVMTRNLLVGMTAVFSEEARSQLLQAVVYILICSLLTGAYHPWAEEVLNWYDMSTCFVLLLIGLFGVVFLSLESEIVFNERHMLWDDADALRTDLNAYATVLLVLIFTFLAEFVGLIVWCIQLLRPAARTAVIKREAGSKKALAAKLQKLLSEPAYTDAFDQYLKTSEEYDRIHFGRVLDKIVANSSRVVVEKKDEAGATVVEG